MKMSKKFVRFVFFIIVLVAIIFSCIFFIEKNNFSPNGDSYMSVLWANIIQNDQSIPDYSVYSSEWNKPGSTYFTPFLHINLAIYSWISGISTVYSVILINSICFIFLFLALFITCRLLDRNSGFIAGIIFILFSGRVLRYLILPGYHYQNLLGDFLLVFSIFLLLVIAQKKPNNSKKEIAILFFLLMALYYTHQLSFFVAFWIIILPLTYFIIKITNPKHLIVIVGAVSLAAIIIFLSSHKFLLELFYATFIYLDPLHISEVKSITEYPALILNGELFLIAGLGIFLYIIGLLNKKLNLRDKNLLLIVYQCLLLLILSFGPLIHLNIPPIRILWYIEYPLIILVSFFSVKFLRYSNLGRITKILIILSLIVLIFYSSGTLNKNQYLKNNEVYNVFDTDSGFDESLEEVANFIATNFSEGKVIMLDNRRFRSVLWIKSFLVPNKTFSYCQDYTLCDSPDIIILREGGSFNYQSNYTLCLKQGLILVMCKQKT